MLENHLMAVSGRGSAVQAGGQHTRLIQRRPKLTAFLVLLLSLIATAIVGRIEFAHAERLDKRHFHGLVEEVRGEVNRRVIVYRFGLMGARSVFAASTYVDRQEFIQLVEARDIDTDFPGALGIGFIERVADHPGAVTAFVEKVQAEGTTDYTITLPPGSAPLPDAVTGDRYLIKYVEPAPKNENAIGLDIGAHPVRREAAERAMLTGDACLTGIIHLVQDDHKVPGFLYLLPYYKPGMPIQTPEQRVAALAGWVFMPMLGPRVFEGIMSVADQQLDVEVFDGVELRDDKLIFDGDNHLAEIKDTVYEEADYSGRAFHQNIPIEIGGRTWTLSLSSTPSFVKASRSEVWLILFGGSALSLLIASLVFLQGNATQRAWALAEGMTADLREYANKAEQATQAKTAFLANMSHEIRTPMTAILGFTDLLRAQIDQDNQELVNHAHTIKRNGEHLLSLINDILDMSKIEAGKLKVEQIAVAPDAVVCEVMSLMRVKADEKKLSLSAQFLTPVPRNILGDSVRLRQILVNLVGNAIKFTERGSVSIEVRYDEHMEELKFAVIDTGVGMTPEQSSRLFRAFEQADETTTRQFGGTGLGLHISQRLANLLGGNITCNSIYGQGSTFTVTVYTGTVDSSDLIPSGLVEELPAAQQKAAGLAEQSAAALNQSDAPLKGLKILLAEDGKDNQRLINHHLTKAGAEVTIVENGRLAVEALCVDGNVKGPLMTNAPFDLVITDMQMPEMDGYTAVRLLRRLGSTLPIVALTAHAMKEDVDKCLTAGCDLYASKPIDKNRLIEVCREAVGKNLMTA